jgi:hypothetical protein
MSPTVVQVFESCRHAREYADPTTSGALRIDVRITPLAAGLIFLLALVLGVLVAVFVQLSAWPAWVNLTAAMIVVFFFVGATVGYISHGLRRDTVNQFESPDRALKVGMVALIAGEIGGFGVILAGFVVGQFF